jgi:hypothetical protein
MTNLFIPPELLPDEWAYRDADPDAGVTMYRDESGQRELVCVREGLNEYDVALEATGGHPAFSARTEFFAAEGVPFHTAVAVAVGMLHGAVWFERIHLDASG